MRVQSGVGVVLFGPHPVFLLWPRLNVDPLTHRVVARWMTAGLRILNRNGEYPTKLLRQMTVEIAKRIGVGNRDIVVRFGTKSGRGDAGVWGEHTVSKGGKHTIYVNQSWSLSTQMETIAHEMQHALQNAQDRLYSGYKHWVWEDEEYPGSTPYRQRPWEKEAFRAQRHGTDVLKAFEAKGLVPKKKSEQLLDQLEAEGKIPARGKLVSEMTREEVLEWVAEREHQKAS